jgi:hypothetical protein
MNRNIALVYKKTKLQQQGNDFLFWQLRSYKERISALEEIRARFFWYPIRSYSSGIRLTE